MIYDADENGQRDRDRTVKDWKENLNVLILIKNQSRRDS